MTSTPTAIDFPDPTDPGFDKTVPFEAPNGQSYLWNGYGWELVCESADGDFLKRYGDVVDDALEPVTYQWNEPVTIETKLKSNREGIKLKSPDSYINVGTIDGDEGQIDLYAADVLDLYGSQAKLRGSNVDVNASFGDVTQTAKNDIVLTATDGAERINRTIDDTNIDDQIVNKRYVDSLFDFSQYDPLP